MSHVATRTRALRAAQGHPPDWAVLSLVCLAQFMVVLDIAIVNVALPAIRNDLGLTTSGMQWVVNGYAIAFAGFLLLGGRAADLYGRKRVFLLGLGLFTLASLAGGLAQNDAWLLAARVAQGLGGAVLAPATLTILTTTFPEGPRRARALGVWSALAGAGGAAGALLGGVLTDLVSWRWILFVNVPVGVLAFAAAWVLLRDTRDEGAPRSLDVLGSILVTGGLMMLVYAIVNTENYPWGSARSVGTLLIATVLLVWFVVHEARSRAPLMPLGIFQRRAVTVSNLIMFLVGAAVFTSWFLLSLYMQNVLGYSPLKAGLAFLPQTVAIIIGAQIGARLVPRIGPRPLLLVGPTISAAGLFWLSGMGADGTYLGTLFVPGVLVTLGVGLAFTPLAWAATAGVPRTQAGLASGLINTTRQVGGALGLAVLSTVAADYTRSLLIAEGRPAAAASGQTGGTPSAAVASALASGYGRAFVVASVLSLAAAVTALALPKPAQPATPSPEPAAHSAGQSPEPAAHSAQDSPESAARTAPGEPAQASALSGLVRVPGESGRASGRPLAAPGGTEDE
jgi:EmrB/QacA subfamily drug resistance transporter